MPSIASVRPYADYVCLKSRLARLLRRRRRRSWRRDPLAAGRSSAAPDPPGEADRREAQRTACHPPLHTGRLTVALEQLTIGVRRFVRRDGPWLCAPLWRRDPAANVGE